MNTQIFARLVRHAFQQSGQLAPVRGKSPLVAFFAGVLFGPFGTGMYLGTFTDFIVPLGLVICGSVMTAGLAAPVFWMLCGAWGAKRAARSCD